VAAEAPLRVSGCVDDGLTDRFLQVGYLTTLSIWRLYSFDDRLINEHEAEGRIRIDKGNRSFRDHHLQCHFFAGTETE
jgi:hypothetical protein